MYHYDESLNYSSFSDEMEREGYEKGCEEDHENVMSSIKWTLQSIMGVSFSPKTLNRSF